MPHRLCRQAQFVPGGIYGRRALRDDSIFRATIAEDVTPRPRRRREGKREMRMVITTIGLEEGAHHVSDELYNKVALLIMSETHPEWRHWKSDESLQKQIDRLAKFIMDEIPGEPSQNEGAVDTAIRLLRSRSFDGGRERR